MSYGTILGQTPAVEPFDPKASNVQFDNSKGQGIVTSTNVQGAIEQIVSKDKSQDSSISSLNSSVSSLRNLFDCYEADGRIRGYKQNQNIPVDSITEYKVPWDFGPSTSYPALLLIAVTNWTPPSYPMAKGGGTMFLLGEDIDEMFGHWPGTGTGIVLTTESKSNYNKNNAYSTKNIYNNNFIISDTLGRQYTYWNNFLIRAYHGSSSYNSFGPELITDTGYGAIGNFKWDRSYFYFSLYTDEVNYSTMGLKVITFNRKKS